MGFFKKLTDFLARGTLDAGLPKLDNSKITFQPLILPQHFLASVKVMLSSDYCHFEVALTKEVKNLHEVDGLRKEAQRLADKAVKQFQIVKIECSAKIQLVSGKRDLIKRLKEFENVPDELLSPEQMGMRKVLADYSYWKAHDYDYEDDWKDDYLECEQ